MPVPAILGISMLVAGIVYPVTSAALDRTTPITVAADAWTFLVPAVAVVSEALRRSLPTALGVAGIALVIAGVAIVNHPRAESSPGPVS